MTKTHFEVDRLIFWGTMLLENLFKSNSNVKGLAISEGHKYSDHFLKCQCSELPMKKSELPDPVVLHPQVNRSLETLSWL